MKGKKSDPRNRDYTVGYGRPPRRSQFPPGKSGNPKGRPKGSKSLRSIVEGVANLKVNVREGTRDRKVNVLQAGLLRLAERVVSGDPKAFATLFGLVVQHQPEQIDEIDSAKISTEDEELLRDFFARKIRAKRGK